MLPNLEASLFAICHQQVPGNFIVNLKHGESHLEGDSAALLGINVFEDCISKHRDESFVNAVAEDRITLAAARLAVGKQRGVESLPSVGYQALAQVIEHFALVHVLGIVDFEISVFSKKI